MGRKFVLAISAVLVVFCGNSLGQSIDSIEVLPEILTPVEPVTIRITGDKSSTDIIVFSTHFIQNGSDLTLTLNWGSSGTGLPVIVGYTHDEPIGSFTVGDYNLTIQHYWGSSLLTEASTSFSVIAEPGLVFVDVDAPPGGDGESWDTAFNDLQSALNIVQYKNIIRVAEGVYMPDPSGLGNPRDASFELVNGVLILGGYAGYGEVNPNERNFIRYITVLSGDLAENDSLSIMGPKKINDPNRTDNSYHVIKSIGVDQNTLLHGITITGGNANGIADSSSSGGGIYNDGGRLTVKSCRWLGNAAADKGGGIYNTGGGQPTMINCVISGNEADYGGGIYNQNNSDAVLLNCTITGNTGWLGGGGIGNTNSVPTLTNCILWYNEPNQISNEFGPVVTYSDIEKGYPGTGNITTDPCFIDADGGDNIFGTLDDDVHLGAGSSCIDAGDNTSVPWDFNRDFEGEVRIFDGIVDMGADESTYVVRVVTQAAGDFTTESAKLYGELAELGPSGIAEVYFEYGTESGNYTHTTVAQVMYSTGTFQATIDQLVDGREYYFRAVGVSGATVYGQEKNFKTVIIEKIFYVNQVNTGLQDGTSWASAYTAIEQAQEWAATGDQIWVAAGTYYPTSDHGMGIGDRGRHFRMTNGVAIYGSFPATGDPTWEERDPETAKTFLSGDIGTLNDPSDNCYHVFYHPPVANLDAGAILDGFTITEGIADGSGSNQYGGGMYNQECSPTVKNCAFVGNTGGGMHNEKSNPTVINCYFADNFSKYGGGLNNSVSHPMVSKCIFIDNSASLYGGGIYNSYSNPTVTGCTFTKNSAVRGGGMYNRVSDPAVTNCVFTGNSVFMGRGGGMYNDRSRLIINSCIFVGNTARYGGGIYNDYYSPTVKNSILWGNTASYGNQIYNDSSSLTVRYCDIASSYTGGLWDTSLGIDGGGNIDVDPLFVKMGNWDNENWVEGDFHLQSEVGRWDPNMQAWRVDGAHSPCIDAGDPASDWKGELWPHGERINMGAYGGTAEASMSLSTVGNRCDLNGDGVVDLVDWGLLGEKWLVAEFLLQADVDRDGVVGLGDLWMFTGEWLWHK